MDEDTFGAIAALGAQLRDVQLFKFPDEGLGVRVNGNGSLPLTLPRYDGRSKAVVLASGLTIAPVEEQVWTFKMGQHFVLEEYIKGRVNEVLSREQMTQLRRVVAAISKSIPLLDKLDEAVQDLLASETLSTEMLFPGVISEEAVS